jgi:hypothetical protein
MRAAPFACSACGSRYWPDPDSSCELCQPSDYDPEYRWRYDPEDDHQNEPEEPEQ